MASVQAGNVEEITSYKGAEAMDRLVEGWLLLLRRLKISAKGVRNSYPAV